MKTAVRKNDALVTEATKLFVSATPLAANKQTRSLSVCRVILCTTVGFGSLFVLLACILLLLGRKNDCKNIADLNFDPVQYPENGYNQTIDSENFDDAFAVVGDFQRTSYLECTISREVNDAETDILVSAIANTSPAFVVILGDLVFDGSDPVHWQHFDYIIRALAKKQTPIFPLLGNHDYCSNNMHLIESHSCNNEAAWKEYSHRFPYRSSLSNGDVQTTWYSHIYGSASWEVRN